MFERERPRLDDEVVILHAIEALLEQGFDRRSIQKTLVRYAPIDLDLFATCFAKACVSPDRRLQPDRRSLAA